MFIRELVQTRHAVSFSMGSSGRTMRRSRTLWVAALLVASCGGVSKWDLACGCQPNSVAAGQELGITEYLEDGSIEPKLLVSKLDAYLLGRGAAIEPLIAIRELGPFHDHACYEPKRETARCHYWLWDGGERRRGIQVDVRGGCSGVQPRSCSINYKYVEEPSDDGV